MKAAFLEEPGKIRVREVADPRCGRDEVIIRIRSTGICGSDLHYYKYGRVGENIVTAPHILGHESSGEVVECGSAVEVLNPGDRVAVEPGVPCMQCKYCLTGHYNLCMSVRFLGAPPYHGTFREFIPHKALFAKKLPEHVSFREAAFVEPLAVGYHAAVKARLNPGARVLITGAGTIGLSCLQMMRVAGAEHISVADRDRFRLRTAGELGADDLIDVNERILPVQAYDCVIEATGAAELFEAVVDGIRKGGKIVMVGMSNDPYVVNTMKLIRKEAEVAAVYRYANCFDPVLSLLAKGMLTVGKMVSHTFSFSDIDQAFQVADDSSIEKLKILVEQPGPEVVSQMVRPSGDEKQRPA